MAFGRTETLGKYQRSLINAIITFEEAVDEGKRICGPKSWPSWRSLALEMRCVSVAVSAVHQFASSPVLCRLALRIGHTRPHLARGSPVSRFPSFPALQSCTWQLEVILGREARSGGTQDLPSPLRQTFCCLCWPECCCCTATIYYALSSSTMQPPDGWPFGFGFGYGVGFGSG